MPTKPMIWPKIWSAMMAWEYSEKTKQLFMDAVHGKPGTHLGEIEDPDGVGRARLDRLR